MTRTRIPEVTADALMIMADLIPLEPYPGSEFKWRCIHLSCGREVAPRYGQIKQGQGGCAYCAGQVVDPDEAAEFMRSKGLEPQVPYPGAMVKWQCIHALCGRGIMVAYNTIQQGQGGCAYCVGKAVDPDEAAEFMRSKGLEPQEPYPGTMIKWQCVHISCGRTVAPMYNWIQQGKNGCAFCAGKTVDPDEAVGVMRSKGLEPQEPYPGSHKPWLCVHTCGREVTPHYSTIRRGGGGCAHCAGKDVDPDEAVGVMRSNGLEPQVPYPGSHKPWLCVHTCGREVTPIYGKVRNGAGGCIHCIKLCSKACECRRT